MSLFRQRFLLVISIILISSCTHIVHNANQSNQRCVANDNSKCVAIFKTSATLSAEQIKLKEQLLMLAQDKSNWPQLIKILDSLMPDFAKLSSENKLKPVLYELAQKLLEMGKLPERITKENLSESVDQLSVMIDNQFIAKGLSQKSKHRYISWLEASRILENNAQKSLIPPRGPNNPSSFLNPIFLDELEKLSETKFRTGHDLKLLVNGPQSFPLREKLIQEARKSIYVMSWAFENDVTGWQFAKQLLERHKSGIDVRIIVDNKTAQQSIYGTVPAWMKEQGLPVIQWKDPEMPVFAFHKKALIVDGQHFLGGGMNFGDVYSHMGPDTTQKWRDTDMYTSGDVTIDAQSHFIKNWNSQIDINKLPFSKIVFEPSNIESKRNPNDPLVMVIDQVPNMNAKDLILSSILKGIEGSTKEINIENAYFIENPALQQALIRALKRGVRVNIFTNSSTSIDVPIISKPILSSLEDLYRLGAKVYLKKGATLHSKFMTVDGLASWVMSYNHHPQSMRIQGEIATVVIDKIFTGQLSQQFQIDISTIATLVDDIQILQPEKNLIDIILHRYFFDQL